MTPAGVGGCAWGRGGVDEKFVRNPESGRPRLKATTKAAGIRKGDSAVARVVSAHGRKAPGTRRRRKRGGGGGSRKAAQDRMRLLAINSSCSFFPALPRGRRGRSLPRGGRRGMGARPISHMMARSSPQKTTSGRRVRSSSMTRRPSLPAAAEKRIPLAKRNVSTAGLPVGWVRRRCAGTEAAGHRERGWAAKGRRAPPPCRQGIGRVQPGKHACCAHARGLQPDDRGPGLGMQPPAGRREIKVSDHGEPGKTRPERSATA